MPVFKLNPNLDPQKATTYELLHVFLQMQEEDKHLGEENRFKRFHVFISEIKTEDAYGFKGAWFPGYIMLRHFDMFDSEIMNFDTRQALIDYVDWRRIHLERNNPYANTIFAIYQGIGNPCYKLNLRSRDMEHMKTIYEGMTNIDSFTYTFLGDKSLQKMWGGVFGGEVSVKNTQEGFEWYLTHTNKHESIKGKYTITPLEKQEPYRIYFDAIKKGTRFFIAFTEDCRALTLSAV